MKVKISAKALKAAVQAASKRIKGPMPVMNCVLLDASGSELAMSCNNYEQSARLSEPCDVQEPGSCLVGSAKLISVVGAMRCQDVVLECNGGPLTVSGGMSKVALPTLDPADFLAFAPPAPEVSVTINGDLFEAMVGTVAKFAAKDNSKPVLQCISVQVSEGELSMTATDSFTIATVAVPYEGKACEVNVRADFLADAASLKGDSVTVGIGGGRATVQTERGAMAEREVEGCFPAWRRLFGADGLSCTVDAGDVARVSGIAKNLSSSAVAVCLKFSEDAISVTAECADGESMSDEIPCDGGFDASIWVNASLLNDVATALSDGPAEIVFSDSLKPLEFGQGGTRAVLMPVRHQ